MRCQLILLLAVYSNIIQASPVRRSHEPEQHRKNLFPRFLNTTNTPSQTTTSAIPSTTIEPIPLYSDPSLDLMVPSRVTTSGDQPQGANSEQKNTVGAGVSPEGGQAVDAEAPLSSAQIGLSSIAVAGPAAETAKLTGTIVPTSDGSQSATTAASALAAVSQSGQNDNDDAQTVASKPRLPVLVNGANAVGVKNKVVPVADADPASSGVFAASSSTAVDPMSAFQAARSPSVTHALTSTSPTQSTAPTDDAKPTALAAVEPTSNMAAVPSAQTGSQSPASSANSAGTSIPTEATLANGAQSATSSSAASETRSPSSTSRPPQYAYPDPIVGASKMAQGYNDVFTGLNPNSPCDPNDPQQASACVRGELAKCGFDGQYTLMSCPQGESCYAVPKSNGQSGLEIGCRNPQAAHQAIAAHSSGSNGAQASQGSSDSQAQGNAKSRGNAAALQAVESPPADTAITSSNPPANTIQSTSAPSAASATTAPSASVVQGSGEQNAQPIIAGHSQHQSSAKKPNEASMTPPSPSPSQSPSPLAVAQADHAPSDPVANDSSNRNAKAADTQFPEPKATIIQEASPGLQPSPKHNKQPSDAQDEGSKQGSQDGDSKHKQQDTASGRSSKSDTHDNDTAAGVQLSFPGNKGPSGEERDAQDSNGNGKGKNGNKDSPETNEKNAVDPKASAASSQPLVDNVAANLPTSRNIPSASSTLGGVAPDTTTAPILGDGFKGFVTVTVTRTTTVHDRD